MKQRASSSVWSEDEPSLIFLFSRSNFQQLFLVCFSEGSRALRSIAMPNPSTLSNFFSLAYEIIKADEPLRYYEIESDYNKAFEEALALLYVHSETREEDEKLLMDLCSGKSGDGDDDEDVREDSDSCTTPKRSGLRMALIKYGHLETLASSVAEFYNPAQSWFADDPVLALMPPDPNPRTREERQHYNRLGSLVEQLGGLGQFVKLLLGDIPAKSKKKPPPASLVAPTWDLADLTRLLSLLQSSDLLSNRMWAAWTLVGAEQVVAHISKSEEAQRATLEALVKVLANSSPVKKGTPIPDTRGGRRDTENPPTPAENDQWTLSRLAQRILRNFTLNRKILAADKVTAALMGAVSTFKGTSVTGAYWAVLALMDMKLCDTAAVMKLIEEIKTAKGKKEDEKHREFPISIQGFDGPEMKFVRDSIMRFYAVRARAVTDPRWLIEGLLAGGKLFVPEEEVLWDIHSDCVKKVEQAVVKPIVSALAKEGITAHALPAASSECVGGVGMFWKIFVQASGSEVVCMMISIVGDGHIGLAQVIRKDEDPNYRRNHTDEYEEADYEDQWDTEGDLCGLKFWWATATEKLEKAKIPKCNKIATVILAVFEKIMKQRNMMEPQNWKDINLSDHRFKTDLFDVANHYNYKHSVHELLWLWTD